MTTKQYITILTALRKAQEAIYQTTGIALKVDFSPSFTSVDDRKAMVYRIAEMVSMKSGISLEDLKAQNRNNHLSMVRHAICYLSVLRITKVSLREIGDVISRDAGSVKNSIEAAEALVYTNHPDFMNLLDTLQPETWTKSEVLI